MAAVASDLLALHAIAALTAATGSATTTTTALSCFCLLTVAGIGAALPEVKEELEWANKEFELSKIPAETLGGRLNRRLVQAVEYSRTLPGPAHLDAAEGSSGLGGCAGPWRQVVAVPKPPSAAAQRASGSGDRGVITGTVFMVDPEVAEPWAVDDAECLQALSSGAWKSARREAAGMEEEEPFVVLPWPRRERPRCALSAAHARLHAERALAVISTTLTSAATHSALTTAPLETHADMPLRFDLDEVSLASLCTPVDTADATAPTAPLYVQMSRLEELVCAAERLLLFLEPSTVDVGALEFHRGAVYMYAARAAQGMLGVEHGQRAPPIEASQDSQIFVGMLAMRSQLAFEAALAWTPFGAVEQRGRCAVRAIAVRIPPFVFYRSYSDAPSCQHLRVLGRTAP